MLRSVISFNEHGLGHTYERNGEMRQETRRKRYLKKNENEKSR